jgi:hypothetical protein
VSVGSFHCKSGGNKSVSQFGIAPAVPRWPQETAVAEAVAAAVARDVFVMCHRQLVERFVSVVLGRRHRRMLKPRVARDRERVAV